MRAQHLNSALAEVLGASGDRVGVRVILGDAAGTEVGVKTSNMRRREFWASGRGEALSHTLALCVSMLRGPVRASMAVRDDGILVLHLLGCQWNAEGTIRMPQLLALLHRKLRFRTLRLVLTGPDLGPDTLTSGDPSPRDLQNAEAGLPRQAREWLQNERKACGDRLELIIRPGRWNSEDELPASPAEWELSVTEAERRERPDLAVILNGGFDENFGSWGATLWELLALGSAVAITGYGNKDGSIGDIDPGCIEVLHMLGGRAASEV
jgi:hypothetical protein